MANNTIPLIYKNFVYSVILIYNIIERNVIESYLNRSIFSWLEK